LPQDKAKPRTSRYKSACPEQPHETMNQRVIPLADERQLRQLPSVPAELVAPSGRLVDSRGRP
jgi:hypothetical protein